tara:strand:- start:6682 stop:7431 length:750 start_codon:yes stop_codon:yes gene_type:complete
MKTSEFVGIIAEGVTPSDVGFLPFASSSQRWEVSETRTPNGLPTFTVELRDRVRADLFNRFVFSLHGEGAISCQSVNVCRNPDKITRGWLAALADQLPASIETVRAPPYVSERMGPNLCWEVFAPIQPDELQFTQDEVSDVIRMDCKGVTWHGIQRILEEIGPPAVTFEPFASPASAKEQLSDALFSARMLVNKLGKPRKWHTKPDLDFGQELAQKNQFMVENFGSPNLRKSHGEMLRRFKDESDGITV